MVADRTARCSDESARHRGEETRTKCDDDIMIVGRFQTYIDEVQLKFASAYAFGTIQ
jgi:hypothetical protein